jgi:hypothetical protein
MPRQDDPLLSGDLYLLRRIPPWAERVTWTGGEPIPSSQNFKDQHGELSFHLEQETTVEEVLAGHDGFGLVHLTAAQIRQVCGQAAILCRDPPPPSHVIVCGKLTGGMRNQLRALSQWVRIPARLDPTTGQPIDQ